MDRAKIRTIEKCLKDAIEATGIEKDLGVKFKFGNARFTAGSVTFALEAAEIGANGTAQTKAVTAFTSNAKYFGLEADDLGKTFFSGGPRGGNFKITGLNPSAHRFPVLAERVSDGKGFKFPVASVQRGLGRKATIDRLTDYSDDASTNRAEALGS